LDNNDKIIAKYLPEIIKMKITIQYPFAKHILYILPYHHFALYISICKFIVESLKRKLILYAISLQKIKRLRCLFPVILYLMYLNFPAVFDRIRVRGCEQQLTLTYCKKNSKVDCDSTCHFTNFTHPELAEQVL
jgi:hypothetical protein